LQSRLGSVGALLIGLAFFVGALAGRVESNKDRRL
jgi:hypothetical protein